MNGCFTFHKAPAKRLRGSRFGKGSAFSLALAIAAAFPNLSSAACTPDFLNQLLTQAGGPFNQRLVGKTFETDNGDTVWIVGTETAMGQLDPKASAVRGTLHELTGDGTDNVLVARAITGSLARMRVTKIANDFDFEGMMIAKVKEGNIERLHDPNSPEIRSIVSYFRAHVESVLTANPHYRFIELKAGEFTDPASGEVKGIKWWLDDVRRGWKDVSEAGGTRRVTLEQAFAEDARVKADWAVPALPDGPIYGAYTEASVLYRFGIKVGNNQIRLRVAKNGHDESLPVRATTVALDPEDMSLLLEASQAAPSLPLEQVHQMILHSMTKYQKIDHLKIIKRVYSLLQFWDEVDDFNVLHGTSYTKESLSEDFLSVLLDPAIMRYGQLKAQAELLKTLEDHHVTLPDGKEQAWISDARNGYGLTDPSLDGMIETLARRIDEALQKKLEEKPHFNEYVKSITDMIPYTDGELTPEPVFLTLTPDEAFRATLTAQIGEWSRKFPHLKFGHPEDAHMTVQFLGRMTDKGIGALLDSSKGMGEGWRFEGGGAHIMGRSQNLIAMAYEPSESAAYSVSVARAKASSFGARPEKRFRAYQPHITIASFDPADPKGRAEAQLFLQETTAALDTVNIHGMDVWTRDEGGAKVGQPVYTPYRH